MHSHVPHSARTGAPQRPAARSHTLHTCLAPRLAPRLPLLPGLGAVAGSLKVLFWGDKIGAPSLSAPFAPNLCQRSERIWGQGQ